MLAVYSRINKVADLVSYLLWCYLHLIVNLYFFALNVVKSVEAYLISFGFIRKYKTFDISKVQYLALVIDSEEAYDTKKVIELLQWLAALGVKQVCLFDAEGVLKKTKDAILQKMKNAILFEEADEKDLARKSRMTLEFISITDGKEAVAKAANLLLDDYVRLGADKEEQIFTEPRMSEALKSIGCKGPEPDLLLIYGPVRCHLGFPAWRMRYTELVHMGPLKSKKFGSLLKAIYKFTTVRQNYGT